MITDVKTSKSFTVLVRIESAERNFEKTAIEIEKKDGRDHLKAIQVGASNTRVVFE